MAAAAKRRRRRRKLGPDDLFIVAISYTFTLN